MSSEDTIGSALAKKAEVELGGNIYTMSAPTANMFERIEAHMRRKRNEEALDILKTWEPSEERKMIVRDRMSPISSFDVDRFTSSAAGGIYFTFLCLEANHPDLTWETFGTFGMQELQTAMEMRRVLETEDMGKNESGAETETL